MITTSTDREYAERLMRQFKKGVDDPPAQWSRIRRANAKEFYDVASGIMITTNMSPLLIGALLSLLEAREAASKALDETESVCVCHQADGPPCLSTAHCYPDGLPVLEDDALANLLFLTMDGPSEKEPTFGQLTHMRRDYYRRGAVIARESFVPSNPPLDKNGEPL